MLKSINAGMLFFPQKLSQEHQYSFTHDFEELNIPVDDRVKLNALHFKVPNPKGVILYMHGNAGSLDTWGGVADDFLALDYDVFIYDYRSYGKSGGKIGDEDQFLADAKVLYDRLSAEYGADRVVLYGRSLGSGVAVSLAASLGTEFQMLILETPFTSMLSLGQHHYPIIPSWFVQYKFDSASKITSVKKPIYLIHGTRDTIVPYAESEALLKIRPDMKLFTIQNGGHNNLSDFADFALALKEIL